MRLTRRRSSLACRRSRRRRRKAVQVQLRGGTSRDPQLAANFCGQQHVPRPCWGPVGNDTGIHCRLAAVEDEVGTKKRIQTTARLQRLPESHVCNVRLRLAWTWTEHDAAVEEALRYRRSVRANLLSDPVDARHATPRTCRAVGPVCCTALHRPLLCCVVARAVPYHTRLYLSGRRHATMHDAPHTPLLCFASIPTHGHGQRKEPQQALQHVYQHPPLHVP